MRQQLRGLAEAAEATIALGDDAARGVAQEWADGRDWQFTGGGPNFATALFSAAKLLEACGDMAVGVDTEEWAHLH